MRQSEIWDRLFLVAAGMIVGELISQAAEELLGDDWVFYTFMITAVQLFICLWLSVHYRDKESQPQPNFDLIDLEEYEKGLLYAKAHGQLPVPVPPVANMIGRSNHDRQMLRYNRQQARELLLKYFPEVARP